jgi:amidase
MVAVAHGNDMGGSIRFPAHCCGLVGLKPTRARTTLGPDFGEFWGPMTHEHVLTRTVRDTAAVLDAIAGPGPGDPYTAPAPVRPFASEVGADPGRLRIGFRTALGDGSAPDPECLAAVEATAALLESLGHTVVAESPAALDDAEIGQAAPALFGTVVARDVDRWSERLGRTIDLGELEPMNALLAELGRGTSGSAFLGAMEAVQRWSRAMAGWWHGDGENGGNGFDVLLLPTSPEPAVPLGLMAPTAKDPFELLMDLTRLTAFTMPFNLTGQPAISLPLHWTAGGLPVGVQLAAAYGREDVLLRVAGQLEQARPWADRRPPV